MSSSGRLIVALNVTLNITVMLNVDKAPTFPGVALCFVVIRDSGRLRRAPHTQNCCEQLRTWCCVHRIRGRSSFDFASQYMSFSVKIYDTRCKLQQHWKYVQKFIVPAQLGSQSTLSTLLPSPVLPSPVMHSFQRKVFD